jgi:hypothetical protein
MLSTKIPKIGINVKYDIQIELTPRITYWSAVSLEATGFVKIPT